MAKWLALTALLLLVGCMPAAPTMSQRAAISGASSTNTEAYTVGYGFVERVTFSDGTRCYIAWSRSNSAGIGISCIAAGAK